LCRDGFGIDKFHGKCDIPGTLTIIQSKDGYLFGGFTSVSWQNNESWKEDSTAFIFTLSSPYSIPPTKYTQGEETQYAICCMPTLIGFGGGRDISVHDNSNQNNSSYTHFPTTYIDSTGKGQNTFTGARNFTTKDIEVYSVVPL
jgi:hypothetical protein